MAHRPNSGPDPAKPAVPTAAFWTRPEEDSSPDPAVEESDFSDLAARFAAHGGGQVSLELSADLALEIVLNEIVEQACLATGATGAAIVMERDGELVCRATSGTTAPELGSRFDTESGLSGECVRTKQIQRCDDAFTDQRADIEASLRLGIRSVMVFPLLRNTEFMGVFEIFSTRPNAFGERDERTLDVLAQRIFKNLDRKNLDRKNLDRKNQDGTAVAATLPITSADTQPYPASALENLEASLPAVTPVTVSDEVLESSPPSRGIEVMTWVLGMAVLACAILLGTLVGHRFTSRPLVVKGFGRGSSAKTMNPSTHASNASALRGPSPAVTSPAASPAAKNISTPSGANSKSDSALPAGGLLVYENGKEVFRMPARDQVNTPGASENDVSSGAEGPGIERASSIEPERMELSPAAAEGSLLRRIEPEYPEEARARQIEGPVVLDIHIAEDGGVKYLKVVSGPPSLAQAAMNAVKQWKFKPQIKNGHRVEMETTVTLNFRLPH